MSAAAVAWRQEETLRRLLQVYLIMGSNNCLKEPVAVLEAAIAGGVTMFQYREKGTGALTGDDRLALASQLRGLCRKHGVPFIVNDDVDLALALDADGVHVGQEDEMAAEVRRRIGEDRILGVSAYDLAEAEAAIRSGADYIGVGPLFSTTTKEDAKAASGLAVLEEMREHGLHIPIVGIGGITSDNASGVVREGADGVSVITAITHAADERAAAEALRLAVTQGLVERG
ncbi:thiamine phosphate synthase [Paenibacillus xylaniclasticus]|uniref:thiamine phosphate synthase n=1 Tax=Paenibacillus xylaniclasticus TaxID=588083 RepID=UPI000FD86FD6|nr:MULTISPECIES: thiamine phosphate synthase [Paenibacillus]GFN32876.1 thiamine-phosphate synthase [Paenibacillus curdlanolyticus]